jgi:LacI family transcriptional regulator
MATMRKVADHAGVGVKTVSRVFNDDPHVDPITRRKVQRSLEALNYIPNRLAVTFRSGKDAAIGVIVPDLTDPFFATTVSAIESVALPRGMAVVIASSGTDTARERSAAESLLGRQVTGLICTPVGPDQSYLGARRGHTPLVFIDREPSGLVADSFVEDDFGGAFAATQHLLGYGHCRVAFIGDDVTVWTTRRRLAGYNAALRAADVSPDPDLVLTGNWSVENSALVLGRLLAQPAPPTALFSSNARSSIAVIPALHILGMTDIAMVSFGDFPLAGALSPALTVIDQDPHHLGIVAADRLFARLDTPGRRLPRRNVLPLQLIPRGSGEQPPSHLLRRNGTLQRPRQRRPK